MSQIINIKNRLLPINESVEKGLEPETKIYDFNIIRELGAGAFGRVYLVEHKVTKVQYAIKAIDKRNKKNLEQKLYFRREIEVMYKLNHPNIAKLYGHFEDNNYCYFLMEYIPKGNLYGLMPKDSKKRINKKVVSSIMKDIISALYYLHNMNPPIIHRDIKPENILLSDGLTAKVTDFGWSNYIIEGIKRTTMCGTPVYLAPEIIKEEGHNEKVDIWCIGVLLFELITGTLPFKASGVDSLKKNILNLNISWPKDINSEAKDLISKILKIEPNLRLELVDIIQHPFFAKYIKDPLQFLIKPEKDIKHTPFIISKDIPQKIDYNNINLINSDNNNINNDLNNDKSNKHNEANNNNQNDLSLEKKYLELFDKYEKLKNDYESLQKGEIPSNEINELNNNLQEKEERIAELLALIRRESWDKEEREETYLKIRYDELEKKNIYYKNKVERYKQFINEHININNSNNKLEKKLTGLRNSMKGKNNKNFDEEISSLQSHLGTESKKLLNEIIKEKDKEIEKIKEETKIRREKEKKKFSSIANKYDKQLTLLEKENEELKAKLKELQG